MIKQPISNRPWLTYERERFFYGDLWSKNGDGPSSFALWARGQFANEWVSTRDFTYLGQQILVVSRGDEPADTPMFFHPQGELARLYREGRLDDLYSEYLSSPDRFVLR